ncbi:MAG: type II secretion system secretin GspD [Gammaproteobacteria bacterium]|nr:type II secretion system secretin GspD [Gammaproteobacteria bacterium]
MIITRHRAEQLKRLTPSLLLSVLLTVLPVASSMAAEGKATLTFKGTDILEVTEAVSKVTGKNFIIDPRVKGKVTILSARSMEAKEIYQVFLTVLEVHGFSVVPAGSVYSIVPSANAKQGALRTQTEGKTRPSSETITRVFHVDNVPATQLVPILRPLLPQHAHMAAYQPTNSLIISDRADNISRLEKIILSIDQPSRGEVEVVSLKHASAAEVMRILTTMEKGTTTAGKDPSGPTFVADERTNSILLAGDTAWRSRIHGLISQLDKPLGIETGNTHVLYLRYAKAEDLAKVLTGVSQAENKVGEKAKKPAASGNASVQADAGTNSLVITAPPEQMRTLQAVVKKLDVPRAQVMVEAIIAEISDDKTRELGFQYLFDGTSSGNPSGGINFDGGGAGSSIVALAAGSVDVGNGLSLAFGNTDMAGVLKAFSGDSGVNILSTPSIVTLDNEEAEISVGEERPFVTGSYTGTGSTTPSNPFTTVTREQVGLTLKVTPQINEGSAIRLVIDQEISSIIPGSETANGPATSKRTVKTTVQVEDGKMLVLGGLIDDQVQEVEQRMPGLGSIPILGSLFKYKRSVKTKRNLMIFLKPTILRDSLQSTLLTSEKYNYIRVQEMAAREEMDSLLSRSEAPVLPDMDRLLTLPLSYEQFMQEKRDTGKKPEQGGQ